MIEITKVEKYLVTLSPENMTLILDALVEAFHVEAGKNNAARAQRYAALRDDLIKAKDAVD